MVLVTWISPISIRCVADQVCYRNVEKHLCPIENNARKSTFSVDTMIDHWSKWPNWRARTAAARGLGASYRMPLAPHRQPLSNDTKHHQPAPSIAGFWRRVMVENVSLFKQTPLTSMLVTWISPISIPLCSRPNVLQGSRKFFFAGFDKREKIDFTYELVFVHC